MQNRALDMPSLLLVENSEDHAVLFQRIFRSVAPHWPQAWVKDGSSAVHRMVNSGIPDLLVICLDTPRLNALDVVEWLRTVKCPRQVKVLIYDSVPSTPTYDRLAAFGVKDYLDKRSPGEKFRKLMARLVAEIEIDLHGGSAGTEKQVVPGFARSHPR